MTARGTVKPTKHFNPESDAALLYGNLRGLATDTSTHEIINVLSKRSNAQRSQIVLSYRALYDRNLIQDIKSGYHGDFLQTTVSMLMSPAEYDAASLHKAFKGVKTDGKVLTEILLTRTNQELKAIKDTYNLKYSRSLTDDIEENCSGDFKRMILKIASEPREGPDSKVSSSTARNDAEVLRRLNQVDVGVLLDIICKRSWLQVKASLDAYQEISPDLGIIDKVAAEFHGEFKDSLKSVIKVAEHTPSYFAEKLFKSMKGMGTDDDTLVRILITRSEVDLLDVKESFENLYGKSLVKYIVGDTSGSYKKLLVAIVEE